VKDAVIWCDLKVSLSGKECESESKSKYISKYISKYKSKSKSKSKKYTVRTYLNDLHIFRREITSCRKDAC